jgi:octaprenyl-diphosphate synthase
MQITEKLLEVDTQELLSRIRKLVEPDMLAVNKLIATELVSEVPLIHEITAHIIDSGGKRLRPLVVILIAKALDYKEGNEHFELAAIIEFIHTATLLHDDVVDNSTLRRGEKTANAIWGNQGSVLTGDFLYSRAFQILARRNNIPVMNVLADTTNEISEGEMLQLMNCNDPNITEDEYYGVIRRKTAQLYSAATEIGAMISTTDKSLQSDLANYGLHLGMAFQMVDDLLDYTASSEESGKNLGDDLAEGKVTLPLLYAMREGSSQQKQLIQQAIKNSDLEAINAIIAVIADTNAVQYTMQCAKNEATLSRQCLSKLPESKYKEALHHLTDFVLDRHF